MPLIHRVSIVSIVIHVIVIIHIIVAVIDVNVVFAVRLREGAFQSAAWLDARHRIGRRVHKLATTHNQHETKETKETKAGTCALHNQPVPYRGQGGEFRDALRVGIAPARRYVLLKPLRGHACVVRVKPVEALRKT